MSLVEVTFTPSGRRGSFDEGTSVLDAARSLGVDLDSICGGRGICGRCQVTVGARPGVDADPGRLSPPGATERGYRGRRPLTGERRLGCAALLHRDVVIDVPPDSQVHRQVIRKEAGVRSLPVDPVVRLHYAEVAAAELSRPTGDLERALDALREEWGLEGLRIDDHALVALQAAIRSADGGITVAVREGRDIVAVWAGFRDEIAGAAFDVGSTTIAGHLCDLNQGAVLASAARMNPQIAFGEDVMSRVSHVMMHPDDRPRLTAMARDAIDELIGTLCDEAGVDRHDLLEITLVGNPIMHHLLLGLDPRPLGNAPFSPATSSAVTRRAGELGLTVHPGARAYVLPCIAGHVGADTSAAILAEGPHRGDECQLLVDVGTNAEIVLGNRHRLLAASSPTGPAFEGAEISGGQRAAPGAIERVRIDRASWEPRYRAVGSDRWSDDDSPPARGDPPVTGICGSGIIEVIAEMFLAGIISPDGVITGVDHPRIVASDRTFSYRLSDDPPISISQNDVRAVQLAKAALQAGCRLLMNRLGVTTVDRIRLAGAFGSHIDPLHAMVLGLVPDCDPDRVSAAGNAAGIGAMMALLSGASRAEAERVAGWIEKVETATEPGFQEEFVAAIGIPNTRHAYPRLAARVDLPPAQPARGEGRRGRPGGRRRPVPDDGVTG